MNDAKYRRMLVDGNVIGTRYMDVTDQGLDISPPGMLTVCQTCEIPLNRIDFGDEQTWVHSSAWREHDHDPIPKLIDRAQAVRAHCDFCGDIGTLPWTYRTEGRIQQLADNYANDYGQNWSACQPCDDRIQHDLPEGNLNTLTDRVVSRKNGVFGTKDDDPTAHNFSIREMVRAWTTIFGNPFTRYYAGPPRTPARITPQLMPKLQQGLIKFWTNPHLYDRVAGHGKHTGQSLPAFCYGDRGDGNFTARVPAGEILDRDAFTTFTKHITHAVTTTGATPSGLYWISRRFTQLAILAGQEMTELVITRDQLPSPHGFLVWEEPVGTLRRPVGEASLRACTWATVPGGIWVNIYFQGEDADIEIDVEQMRSEIGWLMSPNPGTGFAFDEPVALYGDKRFTFINTIFATLMLITQPGVAEEETAPIDKKAARAYQRRHGHQQPRVRLIELRRRRARTTDDKAQHTGKPLEFRRYTRGHWKNQFHGPKRSLRKKIYISPYISGPDNAELRTNPAVNVLR